MVILKQQSILAVIAILFTVQTHAQYKVAGNVTDNKNQAIEFASVLLISKTDSTNIKGTTTRSNGTFIMEGVTSGSYELLIQMLGFADFRQQLELNADTNLSTIQLIEEINKLEEVQLVAERSELESGLGKKILRVGQNLSKSGASAAEAMERIPSVTTTQQGGIQIRGSSNIVIYINGKETNRDAASLRFIPSELIDKIEVITNPSAKYDAEGVAGIVNIVYRKNTRKPLKLNLIANISLPVRGLAGLNASFNRNTFSGYINASQSWSDTENLEDSRRFNDLGELETYQNLIEYEGFGLRTNVDVGLSYQPDSLLTIDFEANYSRWDDDDKALQTNRLTYRVGRSNETFINTSERQELEDEATLTFSVNKKFNNQKRLSFLISASGEDEDNATRFDILNTTQIPDIAQTFLRTSFEDESQRLYQLKVDYESPFFSFGTLETGIKIDYIYYDIFQRVKLQDETMEVPDNDFSVDQEKYAIYLVQKKAFKNFEYGIGARLEHFESIGIQNTTQERFLQENTRIFPSLNLLYRFSSAGHSLGLNFSQRINRPSFFDVNPYISFNDPLNLQTGNPDLEPEIASLFELNYQFRLGKLNTDITGFYRKTDDVIQAIATDIGNGQTLQSLINFDSRSDQGIELLLEYKNGNFTTAATMNLIHSRFRDIDTPTSFNKATAWGLRTNQRLKTERNWTFELVQTFRAPRFQPQRETKSQFYIDASISKKFNNGKGSISLNARDIFDTRDFENEIRLDGVRLTRRFKFQTRRITLALKYSILD